MKSTADQLHALASRYFALRVPLEQRLLEHKKNPMTGQEAHEMALALAGIDKVAGEMLGVPNPIAHLESRWIERETAQRMKSPMSAQVGEPIAGTPESEATKRCRLDLAEVFRLNAQG